MKPTLSAERYAIERAICDKAEAYFARTARDPRTLRRVNFLTAKQAAHPDYAACDNAMRGRVEQYELLTNPPERFGAYIGSGANAGKLTTWTGDHLGEAVITSSWRQQHTRIYAYRVTMAGKAYHGRGTGEGMAVSLKRAKA